MPRFFKNPLRFCITARIEVPAKGELLIKPVKVGFAAYYEELGRVGLIDECAPKGYKQVSISGRELREKLRAGQLPDPRVMRPETAKILIETMKIQRQFSPSMRPNHLPAPSCLAKSQFFFVPIPKEESKRWKNLPL